MPGPHRGKAVPGVEVDEDAPLRAEHDVGERVPVEVGDPDRSGDRIGREGRDAREGEVARVPQDADPCRRIGDQVDPTVLVDVPRGDVAHRNDERVTRKL